MVAGRERRTLHGSDSSTTIGPSRSPSQGRIRSMSVQLERNTPSPALQRRIALHRTQVARRRAEQGDPVAALAQFMRVTFSEEALAETYADYLRAGRAWMDRDDDASEDG